LSTSKSKTKNLFLKCCNGSFIKTPLGQQRTPASSSQGYYISDGLITDTVTELHLH